jgi:threonine/homoserine/homoserine lactone efflux protein
LTDPFAFFAATALLLALPGPTNTLLAVVGARLGPIAALPHLLAAVVAYLAAIAGIGYLLTPLIHAQPVIATVTKIAVAFYLLWLAFRLWQATLLETESGPAGPPAVFFATLLNPKGLIFATTIFPFTGVPLAGYFAAFAVTMLVCGFAWIVLGRTLARATVARPSLVPRVGSLALVAFAGIIAGSAV